MLRDVPGQQFVDAVGLVIRNVREHEFQVGAWIDVVQFARSYRIRRYAEEVRLIHSWSCDAVCAFGIV